MPTECNPAEAPRASVRKAADHLMSRDGRRMDVAEHRGAMAAFVDYELAEITADSARAVGTPPGMKVPAGNRVDWHYHECDVQLGIVTGGSVGMCYDGVHYTRATKGDLIVIPGLGPHEVVEASEDYSGVEVTFPGSFTTIPTEKPGPEIDTPWAVLTWATASHTGVARGLERLAHDLPERFRDKYTIDRERRYRTNAFESASALSHQEGLRVMFVTGGTRTVRVAGEVEQLGAQDMLVVPAGAAWDDVDASDDFDAIWITAIRP